jgi:hypothetical protein
MRESIVVICPTAQGEMRAALWHVGQITAYFKVHLIRADCLLPLARNQPICEHHRGGQLSARVLQRI